MLMFSIFTYTFYNTVHCISEEKYDQNPTDNASNTKDQSQNWKREKKFVTEQLESTKVLYYKNYKH